MRTGAVAIAAAAVLALGVACGGDDGEEAAPATVTEQVTVTAGDDATTDAPATDATTSGDAPDLPFDVPADGDGAQPPPPGDGSAPSQSDIDAAVQAYQQILGLSETQARCLVDRAVELSELNTEDPSAIIAAGGLEIFQDCGIDLADLAGQFGAQP